MRDIITILERWTNEGKHVALGSVIERIGSAPRDPGAALAVSSSGEVAGTVTGGCVEPAVIREATEVLQGAPGRICRYGLTDEEGFEAGLACGGTIAIAVYPLDPGIVAPIGEAIASDRAVALTVRLDDGHLGEQSLVFAVGEDRSHVAEAARAMLELGESGVVETPEGELVFVESYVTRPELFAFGVSDHVAALVPIAKFLGYRVTVCDPRRTFLTPERFPQADALVDDWPDRFLAHVQVDARTAICVMTHDLKLDVPALELALASPAGYIGAMGSEKTRAERDLRMHELGIGDAELARVHAPIGIYLGARTPEEVAISIGAQLVEVAAVARSQRAARVARATVLS
jgi:xanthine dehydrogenase accessory factor